MNLWARIEELSGLLDKVHLVLHFLNEPKLLKNFIPQPPICRSIPKGVADVLIDGTAEGISQHVKAQFERGRLMVD